LQIPERMDTVRAERETASPRDMGASQMFRTMPTYMRVVLWFAFGSAWSAINAEAIRTQCVWSVIGI